MATFRPSTHVASLWTYHDNVDTPHGPPSSAPAATSARTASAGDSSLTAFLSSPQLPYIALGLGALAVVFTAVLAHLRGRVR